MSPQGFQPPTFQPHPAQQAPTSTGGSVPQARSRIDPNQVPSPLVVHEQDQLQYDSGAYSTTCRQVPPLATTQYKAIDDGCSNPRFMRLTTYNFPLTDELANLTNVPLGLILQPLADLSHEEEPIEVVDFGESGPIRCNRCKAYLNPYFMWIEGGRRYVCNLCGFSNECPAEYFSNLDMNGRRMDYNRRPELRRGTIEFVATKEYCARPPRPVSYVFAIDISWAALQSGMVQVAVDAIKSILYPGETGNGLPAGAKVGIVSFDKSVQFYNLAAALDQPQMLVVADMEDVFVPLNDGFLVDPIESRTVIGNLLDTLPTIFETNRTAEVALGALAQATLGALKDLGGKLTIFQSMLPTFGPGALKNREDPKLLGTDKERMLYEPQEYFWRKLGQEFSSAGVCVDMFLFPTQYIDVATIGSLSALTGGEVWHYPNFDRQRDGRRFSEDLKRSVRRTFGYEALLRIRASNGLKITEHFGNFYMKNSTDVELAGLNSQTAIGVALKHDGKLDEKQDSALQAALLYTTADGHRRIRVLNMSIPNTGTLGNVFRFAEMDTTINFLIKAAIAQTVSANLKAVRDRLFEKCVQVLAAYRKHVAHASSPGQLILPESFKLYALYTLSVLRLKAFRGGPDLSTDIRVFHMRQLKSMGVAESVPLLYPRLMRIDTITPPLGELDDRNRVKLPPSIRVSAERLAGDGVYLAENGQSMVVWIGKAVVGDVVRNLFGVERVEDIDPKMKELPHLPNPLSQALQRILLYIQYLRPRYLDLRITRQGLDPLAEAEFHSTFMVEDAGVEMGYVDWLVNVHRQIQMEISNS
ncbi:Sec23/Sec24 trunk domain-containing protein [Gaertneriomyces semiglobifer]|nr:Sec23/Sec24 trunk domain-containing protein [Gaertneriomyces semiglobifer]